MTPLRRVAGRTFSSMGSRNLRLYFGGSIVSQIGSWIQLVSLPWLVLHLTHSGTMLGLTYALQFLPILLLGAWAGVVADRYDKRHLLLITTTLLGVCALVLGVITLLDRAEMWNIALLALLLGTVAAFDNPVRRAFVPELVDHHEVTNAVSLNNAVFTSARIVGPSIAGILIATVGIGWCFVLNALSFGAVIVALQMMSPAAIHRSPPLPRAKGQLRAGIRYAWDEPLVRLAIIMTFVIGVMSFNYQVVLPLLAKRTFVAGPAAYALMFAATGIGSLIGALMSAHRARADASADEPVGRRLRRHHGPRRRRPHPRARVPGARPDGHGRDGVLLDGQRRRAGEGRPRRPGPGHRPVLGRVPRQHPDREPDHRRDLPAARTPLRAGHRRGRGRDHRICRTRGAPAMERRPRNAGAGDQESANSGNHA